MTKPSGRQLGALGFCAFSVPAVLLLPRVGWLWATAAALLSAALLLWGLSLLRKQETGLAPYAAGCKMGKSLLVLALIWNFLLLGAAARQLCATFPDGKGTPLVGLLLLLTAAYAAGRNRGSRIASIVFFFLLGLYGLLFGFSLPELRSEYLDPLRKTKPWQLSAALAPLCLLYLSPSKGKGAVCWCAGGILLAFVAAFMTAGILSPAVAAEEAFPLYEAAKSVSLFGVLGRLEPLVSAAVSMGGFCLLYLLCSANGSILNALIPRKKVSVAPVNFFSGLLFFWLSALVPTALTAIGTAIFWGVFPLGTLFLGYRKKLEKI